MSIPCQLSFLHRGEVVDSFPRTVSYGSSQTPFEYVQSIFDALAHSGPDGFIRMRRTTPFDSLAVRWPDGTLYTWEAILIRNSFRVPDFILDRLVDGE